MADIIGLENKFFGKYLQCKCSFKTFKWCFCECVAPVVMHVGRPMVDHA